MKLPPLKISRINRKAAAGSNAVFSFVLVIIATIFAGVIVQNLSNLRVDISEDKLSSLSPASRNIIARLDDPATVTLYISNDLPAYMQVVKRNILDTLESYRSSSNGKLSIKVIDPAKDSAALTKVQQLGIPELQFNVRSSEKISLQRGYLGLSLAYRSQDNFIMPVIQDTGSFEYDFSSLLKKALDQDLPPRNIYFLTGHGELESDSISAVRKALAENAQVNDLDLSKETTIPNTAAVLIIAGATESIPPEQLQAIDQYLMAGGKLLILIDAITVDNNLQTTKVTTGIEEMLAKYGVNIGTYPVGDNLANEILPFTSGQIQFLQQYPYLVRIIKENINSDSPITRDLDTLSLFWPTKISVTKKDGVESVDLFSTTEQGGFVAAEPINLLPTNTPDQINATSEKGKINLAVTLSGAIPSAYPANNPTGEQNAPAKTSTDGRLVVIGDADIIRDDVLQRFSSNGILFMNTVDWLVQDEDLIQIRSKSAISRSFNPLEDKQRVNWKWANLLVPPLLILIGGIVAWRLRRRS